MLIEIQWVFLVSNTSIGKQAFLGVLGPYIVHHTYFTHVDVLGLHFLQLQVAFAIGDIWSPTRRQTWSILEFSKNILFKSSLVNYIFCTQCCFETVKWAWKSGKGRKWRWTYWAWDIISPIARSLKGLSFGFVSSSSFYMYLKATFLIFPHQMTKLHPSWYSADSEIAKRLTLLTYKQIEWKKPHGYGAHNWPLQIPRSLRSNSMTFNGKTFSKQMKMLGNKKSVFPADTEVPAWSLERETTMKLEPEWCLYVDIFIWV